jgi:anti-sigma B factor antagonist
MQIHSRKQGEVLVFDFDGKMTISAGSAAHDAIVQALADGEKKILLDLEGVSVMDSSGVGELMASYTSAKNRGAALKLLKLAPRVGEVLRITQLIGFFQIYDDLQTALASFE